MKALEDFNALMDRRAETLEAAGLTDMVRGMRLAQTDAANAISAAVAEATAPPPPKPIKQKRGFRSPETREAARQRMLKVKAIYLANCAARRARKELEAAS